MHPILIQWGPLTLYSYGLMAGLGFLIALAIAFWRARRMGLSESAIQSVAILALLGGLVGARAAYVGLHWHLYRDDLFEIVRLDHGGLVFYGGSLGGIAGAIFAARYHRLPVGRTLDLMTPAVIVAHAIGRVGCFLNGCCYGRPTQLPLGVLFPGHPFPRHPTQLYEVLALLAFVWILLKAEKILRHPGSLFGVYLVLYSGWRFWVEFLRGDHSLWLLGLTVYQWISLLLFGFGILWLWMRRQSV
jgi:phosphatidylglycerol:prolipoprotein diacylglycerol transferase